MFSAWTRFSFFLVLLTYPVLSWGLKPIPVFEKKYNWGCLKYRVHVINGFSSNKVPLSLHCQSNDDDLGNHTLYNGQEFNFQFRRSMLSYTHFTCDMKWGSKHNHVDVYREDVEGCLCCGSENCYWRTQDDGIYFSNNNQYYFRREDWKR